MFVVIEFFKYVIGATVMGYMCLCLFVFLFYRYRRFRRAAFESCGALLTTTGINDDSVVIEGAMNFSPPGPEATLHDAVLENQSWTGAPEFMFSNELAGGATRLGRTLLRKLLLRLEATLKTVVPAIRLLKPKQSSTICDFC